MCHCETCIRNDCPSVFAGKKSKCNKNLKIGKRKQGKIRNIRKTQKNFVTMNHLNSVSITWLGKWTFKKVPIPSISYYTQCRWLHNIPDYDVPQYSNTSQSFWWQEITMIETVHLEAFIILYGKIIKIIHDNSWYCLLGKRQ